MIVLGIDPGLANFGVCLAEMHGDDVRHLKVLAFEVWSTKKNDHKGRDVHASFDSFDRARTLSRNLLALMHQHDVRLVAFESMSLPRNAGNSSKIGLAFGVLACATSMSVAVVSATPQEIKKAVCADRKAPKEQIVATLSDRYGPAPGIAKTRHEHCYDALGAIVACWQSETMRIMRSQKVAA